MPKKKLKLIYQQGCKRVCNSMWAVKGMQESVVVRQEIYWLS